MNKYCFLASILLIAATSARAQTAAPASPGAAIYVEPSAVLACPADYNRVVGAALAVGYSFTPVHAIEAEVIHFKSTAFSEDAKFTPLLATYQYSLSMAKGWALSFSGSAGATRLSGGEYYYGTINSTRRWIDYSDTLFTYGAGVETSYAFTENVSVVGGVKALKMQETYLAPDGGLILITAGLRFRF